MAPTTIAVIAAGAMGSAVAHRLASQGCSVLTNLHGRSSDSLERARKAGMQVVSLEEVVSRSEWLLSIIPPDKAESFAEQVFKIARSKQGTGLQFKFADCNATSPATVRRIAALATEHEVPFVDACIIGGPPREGYDPTFYASGSDPRLLEEFGRFGEFGLKVRLMEGDGVSVGDASALKMSYAGITKGTTGLAIAMVMASHASSPATAKALLNELSLSQLPILKRLTWSIPDAFPKAYRFEGEMREISDFVTSHLGPGEGKIHEGIANVYHRVAALVAEPTEELEALKEFVEGGSRAISSPPST